MTTKNCYIYTGPTGCGKTFQAFNRLNKKERAVYIGPCRQLIYETAQKYGNSNCHIKTSDIEIGDRKKSPISFRTYEALRYEEIRMYKTIIIDEAHFINDYEKGQHLLNIIYKAEALKIKTILLSATMDFTIAGAKIINLPPRGEEYKKMEVTYEEALERAKNGVPTIYFKNKRKDCGSTAKLLKIKGAAITADTTVCDRIRIIKLFEQGKITLIESTNALAQGVNIPCENIINEYNSFDDDAVIVQKLGRLGRTGVTPKGAELTYCSIWRNQNEIAEMQNHFNNKNKKQIKVSYNKTIIEDKDLKRPATEQEKTKLKNSIIKTWSKKNK